MSYVCTPVRARISAECGILALHGRTKVPRFNLKSRIDRSSLALWARELRSILDSKISAGVLTVSLLFQTFVEKFRIFTAKVWNIFRSIVQLRDRFEIILSTTTMPKKSSSKQTKRKTVQLASEVSFISNKLKATK